MTGVQPADRQDLRPDAFLLGEQPLSSFESLKSRREFLAVARTGRRSVRPGLILQAGTKHVEGRGL